MKRLEERRHRRIGCILNGGAPRLYTYVLCAYSAIVLCAAPTPHATLQYSSLRFSASLLLFPLPPDKYNCLLSFLLTINRDTRHHIQHSIVLLLTGCLEQK